jgi:hypothetical protein
MPARATGTNNTKQSTQSATQPKTQPAIHEVTGMVSSVTGSQLVLDHKWKGKDEKTTFMLNPDTKKEGSIMKGDRASVYYHVENKQRVATDVKVSESKPKTEAKKS